MKMTGPSTALLRNIRKVATYHSQTIIFTMVVKTSEKAKHTAIEEVFYGNVSKNVIGAPCQQLVDGDHAFANLYNSYKGDDSIKRSLKPSSCGRDTTSNYVAGRDFTAKILMFFSNGKPFQGQANWKMADSVLASLKKALSLVPQLSPKMVMINNTCRVVGYDSGKNEVLFLQVIDNQTQLQDVGSEERVCNHNVLSVLSTVATSMGLRSGKTSSGKMSGEVASNYNN